VFISFFEDYLFRGLSGMLKSKRPISIQLQKYGLDILDEIDPGVHIVFDLDECCNSL
jgi:Fe-S cluster assembly ATPase SufC